ncbi:B3 domain-containing protein isoform X1 [Gossypium australe]|uniref:B3 domain-containing protein isoform X1 n=1 Tax=Gossypium australe TaxID=47621 RepID=A0A5B6WLX4_9ROSI|nr:B3 domain-containing protein isoform X1 [Gossypium australe]
MKIKIEEEEEELFDDEGNDRLPISQLFQLLQQRQPISMENHIGTAMFRYPKIMETRFPHQENIHDCRQKASRKRPRDKNYNDHVVTGTKRVSEQDFAKSPVIERAEQVQANLSAEFPSFFKIMIPSVVCRGFWMSLPKEFCQLNLPNHDATVILVGETGKEYRINFLVQRKALSGGWKKSFLRAQENQSENGTLDVGSSEVEGIRFTKTVSIADAIRASEISTPRSGFVPWDNALNSFDFLGTDVGSLHKRVHHVLNHTFESKPELKLKYKEAKLERAYAEQETKSLESDLSGKKEEMQRLDAEIDALTVNAKRYELMFEAAANAPCKYIIT